ncbi:hypothetical protein AVEN_255953-1 [Araneus ventricosus]|uniref:Uncharacterized protein n=1 Tax=Araneus ventricosus TaxID=182803 RepID=A0A4Y2J8L5_ARAVE|nr:hypothetical protein AVEN_255953-1 [Araneus ventricosus]
MVKKPGQSTANMRAMYKQSSESPLRQDKSRRYYRGFNSFQQHQENIKQFEYTINENSENMKSKNVTEFRKYNNPKDIQHGKHTSNSKIFNYKKENAEETEEVNNSDKIIFFACNAAASSD